LLISIPTENIEALISNRTIAIVPVHAFGNPCEFERIQEIANKHKFKIAYDAAHCFGTEYKGESVQKYAGISTVSFHATKLLHTVEGGAVITNDDKLAKKVRLLVNFGIRSQSDFSSIGTNAKTNEIEAAMGLCVLDEIAFESEQKAKI